MDVAGRPRRPPDARRRGRASPCSTSHGDLRARVGGRRRCCGETLLHEDLVLTPPDDGAEPGIVARGLARRRRTVAVVDVVAVGPGPVAWAPTGSSCSPVTAAAGWPCWTGATATSSPGADVATEWVLGVVEQTLVVVGPDRRDGAVGPEPGRGRRGRAAGRVHRRRHGALGARGPRCRGALRHRRRRRAGTVDRRPDRDRRWHRNDRLGELPWPPADDLAHHGPYVDWSGDGLGPLPATVLTVDRSAGELVAHDPATGAVTWRREMPERSRARHGHGRARVGRSAVGLRPARCSHGPGPAGGRRRRVRDGVPRPPRALPPGRPGRWRAWPRTRRRPGDARLPRLRPDLGPGRVVVRGMRGGAAGPAHGSGVQRGTTSGSRSWRGRTGPGRRGARRAGGGRDGGHHRGHGRWPRRGPASGGHGRRDRGRGRRRAQRGTAGHRRRGRRRPHGAAGDLRRTRRTAGVRPVGPAGRPGGAPRHPAPGHHGHRPRGGPGPRHGGSPLVRRGVPAGGAARRHRRRHRARRGQHGRAGPGRRGRRRALARPGPAPHLRATGRPRAGRRRPRRPRRDPDRARRRGRTHAVDPPRARAGGARAAGRRHPGLGRPRRRGPTGRRLDARRAHGAGPLERGYRRPPRGGSRGRDGRARGHGAGRHRGRPARRVPGAAHLRGAALAVLAARPPGGAVAWPSTTRTCCCAGPTSSWPSTSTTARSPGVAPPEATSWPRVPRSCPRSAPCPVP